MRARTAPRGSRVPRGALTRSIGARLALIGLPLFGAWSISAPMPGEAPSSQHCEVRESASTAEYLTGLVCPPPGFAAAAGYEPELVVTPSGWRFVRPPSVGAECSGPLDDTGPFWDFAAACGTHDYGYDLVRFGEGRRRDVDVLLYEDMLWSCDGRGIGASEACRGVAEWAHAALAIGDVAGMEPVLGDFR